MLTGRQKFRMELEQLPLPLAGFLLGFLGVSLTQAVRGLDLSLATLVLGIFPLVVCFSLWRKSRWFFLSYIFQCVGLVGLLVVGDDWLARPVLFVSMVVMAFLVGNPNLLYPMMTKSARFWRRSERYRVGRSSELRGPEFSVPVFLEDCSATGLALSLPENIGKRYLLGQGQALEVVVTTESPRVEHLIPVTVVWSAVLPTGDIKLGCESRDRAASREYLRQETAKQAARFPSKGVDNRLEEDVRGLARILWLTCALLVGLIP